jgi:hypothetical protein
MRGERAASAVCCVAGEQLVGALEGERTRTGGAALATAHTRCACFCVARHRQIIQYPNSKFYELRARAPCPSAHRAVQPPSLRYTCGWSCSATPNARFACCPPSGSGLPLGDSSALGAERGGGRPPMDECMW